jgi:hemoglobin
LENLNERRAAALSHARLARDGGPTLYDQLGGEQALRRLVDEFYDIIEFEPEGASLRRLHLLGHGIAHSRQEQFLFLTGFLGGPSLYAQRHGHSNVRELHHHVEIDEAAKDTWLRCMTTAMERAGLPADVSQRIMSHFAQVAATLVNR